MPAVLADRAADTGVANGIWPAQRPRIKNPHLVKHGFIRQVVFQAFRCDLATFQDQISVEKLAILDPRAANRQRRTLCRGCGQCLHLGNCGLMKGRFHHQILRIVAGDEHLRQRHKVSPGLAPLLPCAERLGGIASQIANGRVQLRKRDAKTIGHLTGPRIHLLPSHVSDPRRRGSLRGQNRCDQIAADIGSRSSNPISRQLSKNLRQLRFP